MYQNHCIVCGKIFETSSKYADVCSSKCRKTKAVMPMKADKPFSSSEIQKDKEIVDKEEETPKKPRPKMEHLPEEPRKPRLTSEMLQKMTWVEKYNGVDTLTKISMLSKALFEENILYSYGELRIVYDSDRIRYKKLEKMIMEKKSEGNVN